MVTLQELLQEAQGERSFYEMAKRCGLSQPTVTRIVTGKVARPQNKTILLALSRGYGIDPDKLARAAYGLVFEEIPESTATPDEGTSEDDDEECMDEPEPRRAAAT